MASQGNGIVFPDISNVFVRTLACGGGASVVDVWRTLPDLDCSGLHMSISMPVGCLGDFDRQPV